MITIISINYDTIKDNNDNKYDANENYIIKLIATTKANYEPYIRLTGTHHFFSPEAGGGGGGGALPLMKTSKNNHVITYLQGGGVSLHSLPLPHPRTKMNNYSVISVGHLFFVVERNINCSNKQAAIDCYDNFTFKLSHFCYTGCPKKWDVRFSLLGYSKI